MKKVILSLLAICAATSSFAVVSVNWLSPASAIKDADGTTNAPATWFAQLIWSDDAAVSPLNPADPFVPTGGESVFASNQISPGNVAGRVTVGKVSDADNGLAGGFVYTRVFNVDFNGGSPGTPTFYGDSPVITGALLVETGDPTTVLRHWSTTTSGTLNVSQRIVAIPEPSTYALAAVGIAAALWRRRRKA